jgi:hypothetical protein
VQQRFSRGAAGVQQGVSHAWLLAAGLCVSCHCWEQGLVLEVQLPAPRGVHTAACVPPSNSRLLACLPACR